MALYLGRKAIRKVPGTVIKAVPIVAAQKNQRYEEMAALLSDSEIRMLLDQIGKGY